MSELPLDLEFLIFKTLKGKALADELSVPDDCKVILTNPTGLKLEDLLDCCQKFGGQSESLLVYMLGLIILRVSKDAPLYQKQGLKYFETFKYFIDNWPDYKESAIKTYFPALIKELLNADHLDFPFWAQKISMLQLPEPLSEKAKKLLQHQTLYLSCILLEKAQNTSDSQPILELLDFFIGINNTILDIKTVLNMSFCCILENLITVYDLRDYKKNLGEKTKNSFNELKELIVKIKWLNGLNDENMKKIGFIEKEIILRNIHIINYEKKIKQVFGYEELIMETVDWNQMTTDPTPVFNYNTDGFNIVVTRMWFPNGLIMIRKSYIGMVENADFSSVENEIRILKFLSNRAQAYNCYLKFFGDAREYGKIHLYMEEGGRTLMQVLTEYIDSNTKIELTLLETWMMTLLQCFAELTLNRIYHCDINLNNILINQNNTIKVIGFGAAQCLANKDNFIIKSASQPTKNSNMAPELLANLGYYSIEKYISPGKSDVFSLGLTFLQIITLSTLTGLNTLEKNSELHLIIDSLTEYPHWIKNLLHAMLYPTGKKRPGFNKCLAYADDQKKNLEVNII